MKLRGIIPPVVTPFTANQELDLPRLRQHIDWQLSHGVHGIFVLGTTGEFYALDEAEKQPSPGDEPEMIELRLCQKVKISRIEAGDGIRQRRRSEADALPHKQLVVAAGAGPSRRPTRGAPWARRRPRGAGR